MAVSPASFSALPAKDGSNDDRLKSSELFRSRAREGRPEAPRGQMADIGRDSPA